jgi:phage terminase small subunit
MPILKNAKYEAMALGLADGKSQERAYVDAGFAKRSARANAATLLKRNRSILERRDEILTERERLQHQNMVDVAESEKVNLIGHLRMLAALREEARKAGKYQAAIAAEVSRGRACGLYVERIETGRPGDFDDLTDEQLEAELKALDAITQAQRTAKSGKKKSVA